MKSDGGVLLLIPWAAVRTACAGIGAIVALLLMACQASTSTIPLSANPSKHQAASYQVDHHWPALP